MDDRVRCAGCGALNRPGAAFCGLCLRRTVAPPVAPVRLPGVVPLVATAGGPRAPERYVPPPPAPSPPAVEGPPSPAARWRWPHLLAVGVTAWGIPTAVNLLLAGRLPLTQFLDASVLIQILGYLVAAGIIGLFVRRSFRGDWSSLGLRASDATLGEILRGAGFGLVLLAVWLPAGLFLSRGSPPFDALVSLLIGDTSAGGLLLAAAAVVLGAPLIEETYYRGMLFAKLSKRGPLIAVGGTSVLFVVAHGALLIPALLVLGFGLGAKRLSKSLWYTISAHASWNLAIVCLAAYLLLGPAKTFTPADGAYRLRHSSDWQRVAQLEGRLAGGVVDLALSGSGGSVIAVGRFDVPRLPAGRALPALLEAAQTPKGFESEPGHPTRGSTWIPDAPPAFETTAELRGPDGTSVRSRYVALIPDGWSQALMFNLACPPISCPQADQDLERMLSSLQLDRDG
jgi:membrane protease YdiL (CAAX protease family)